MKNILIVSSKYPCFYQPHNYIFVEDQANILALDYRVQVVCCISISLKDIFKKGIRGLGVVNYTKQNVNVNLLIIPSLPKMKWLNNFFRYLGNKYLIHRFVTQIDLIHLHSYLSGDIAIELKNNKNIPYIVTEHSSLFYSKKINDFDLNLAKKVFSNSSKNFAVSYKLSRTLDNIFGASFSLLYNVVDTSLFKPYCREESNKLSFITIGNLVDEKNHELMIRSFAKAFSESADVTLSIIGYGYNYELLKELIISLGVENRVFLLGLKSRDEIVSLLNEADVYVMTSKYETFCIALVEAMSLAKPILCTDFGGVVDSVRHLEDVFVVDHTEDDIARAFKKVACKSDFNSIINREFVINNFSKEVFRERINLIYSDVLNGK